MGSRLKPEKVCEALRAAHGLASGAARALGCTDTAVRAMIRRNPLVKAAADEASEIVLDLAEGRALKEIGTLVWRDGERVVTNPRRERIRKLVRNVRAPDRYRWLRILRLAGWSTPELANAAAAREKSSKHLVRIAAARERSA